MVRIAVFFYNRVDDFTYSHRFLTRKTKMKTTIDQGKLDCVLNRYRLTRCDDWITVDEFNDYLHMYIYKQWKEKGLVPNYPLMAMWAYVAEICIRKNHNKLPPNYKFEKGMCETFKIDKCTIMKLNS